jgi:hypothetical protein
LLAVFFLHRVRSLTAPTIGALVHDRRAQQVLPFPAHMTQSGFLILPRLADQSYMDALGRQLYISPLARILKRNLFYDPPRKNAHDACVIAASLGSRDCGTAMPGIADFSEKRDANFPNRFKERRWDFADNLCPALHFAWRIALDVSFCSMGLSQRATPVVSHCQICDFTRTIAVFSGRGGIPHRRYAA